MKEIREFICERIETSRKSVEFFEKILSEDPLAIYVFAVGIASGKIDMTFAMLQEYREAFTEPEAVSLTNALVQLNQRLMAVKSAAETALANRRARR